MQGFLELVERDSVALWWYNRVPRPRVDLSSFGHPSLDAIGTFLRERGRDLWALDLTSDLGIPVFATVSRAVEGPEGISLGFGAHLDPDVALMRAVTEHMQTLAVVLPADRRGGLSVDAVSDPEARGWLTGARVAEHPYLAPDPRARPRSRGDFLSRASGDLLDDILACQAVVERHGLELLVLDATRPEIGVPVVKVIVPGLRHFWARFAPGRLFDVPVKLGWADCPRPEAGLNPVALFL